MKQKFLGVTFFAAVTLALAGTAQATSFTINFDGAQAPTLIGNTYGSGVTATATAWGLTGDPTDTTFQTAYLNSFTDTTVDEGLGACNTQSDGTGGDGGLTHCVAGNLQESLVDNVTTRDFVLLTFSQPVNISTITLHGNGTDGANLDFWLGTGTFSALGGDTLAQVLANGFGSLQTRTNGSGSSNDTISSGLVSEILLAPPPSGGTAERFRIDSITGTAVPEPGALALMGTGLLVGAGRLRKRLKRGL